MRKILVLVSFGLAFGFAHAEDCALLLFPESETIPVTFSARYARENLRRAFPAGLFKFPPAVHQVGSPPPLPVLDEIEITSEISLPGVTKSGVTFAQVWYRGMLGKRLTEGLAKYSIVQLSDGVEKRQSWIIEHPERGMLGKAEDYYASYNADREAARDGIRLQPVLSLKDARLAMYLAALSVPKTQQVNSVAFWSRPILRPMLVSQSCVDNDCTSRVKVRAVYSRYEKFTLRQEGNGELRTVYDFNVRIRNGRLISVTSDLFAVQEIERRLVRALELIAEKL